MISTLEKLQATRQKAAQDLREKYRSLVLMLVASKGELDVDSEIELDRTTEALNIGLAEVDGAVNALIGLPQQEQEAGKIPEREAAWETAKAAKTDFDMATKMIQATATAFAKVCFDDGSLSVAKVEESERKVREDVKARQPEADRLAQVLADASHALAQAKRAAETAAMARLRFAEFL